MEAIAKQKVGVGHILDLLEIIEMDNASLERNKNDKSKVIIRQDEYLKYEHCAELFGHLQEYYLPLEIEDRKLTPL